MIWIVRAGGWATAVATQHAATVISGAYTEARKLTQQLQASRMAAGCQGPPPSKDTMNFERIPKHLGSVPQSTTGSHSAPCLMYGPFASPWVEQATCHRHLKILDPAGLLEEPRC